MRLSRLVLFSSLLSNVWARRLDEIDLYEVSIAELQAGLESRSFTAVDLVKAYLGRINQVNHAGPKLNAIIETNKHALHQARELDEERKVFGKRSSLHGIPILVKDSISTLASEGMNTTAGSYALFGSVVREEATVVAKLRKAGAIILGKANMCEWSYARGDLTNGWSGRGGQTTSPFYPGSDPCTSSGGSAVAATLGLAAASLGVETRGSIICPSSYNNLVGLKPTVGLTSRAGVISMTMHQDTVGPITRSVADAATILNIIAGQDERDNFTSTAPSLIPDYTKYLDPNAIRGKRFGVPRKGLTNETMAGTHPSVNIEFGKALDKIRELGGVVIDPADLPSAEEIPHRHETWAAMVQFKILLRDYIRNLVHVPTNVTCVADVIAFNNAHKDLERPEGYEDQSMLELAETTEGFNSTYFDALHQNHMIGRERGIDAALKTHGLDALLLPTNMHTAVPAGLAGYPVITVPLGFHPEGTKPNPDTRGQHKVLYPAPGMPFGLSFIGTAYTEQSLIGFAYAYEQYTHTRLQRRAYSEAIPTVQLKDVVEYGVFASKYTSIRPGDSAFVHRGTRDRDDGHSSELEGCQKVRRANGLPKGVHARLARVSPTHSLTQSFYRSLTMIGLKVTAILAACASVVVAVPTYKNNNSCDNNSFWYATKSICLPNGTKDKCNPPANQNCGHGVWYWHKDFRQCVPSSPNYGDVDCSNGWKWDDGKYSCVPAPAPAPGPDQCKPSHFWWKTKSTCLPNGGDYNSPQPPNGVQCPRKWYWLSVGYCGPRTPDYGTPDCDSKYTWDNDKLCCQPKRY
ncbi:Amidase [Rhizoctonia solani]|uniref:Amidase n=2 Tax=Rhizoctonia solani TaxID=456999 RepID=A0A8H7LFA3_9AGAM|nr:Amidase [Rhizoctonia solani]